MTDAHQEEVDFDVDEEVVYAPKLVKDEEDPPNSQLDPLEVAMPIGFGRLVVSFTAQFFGGGSGIVALSIYFGRLVAPKLDVLELCIWALGAGSMQLPLILGARGRR